MNIYDIIRWGLVMIHSWLRRRRQGPEEAEEKVPGENPC
jgi:hypothetical protein